MKTLHVLYDDTCGLCRASRDWLQAQRKYVALEFHAAQDPRTARRFPGLASLEPEELVVVSDTGGVYRHARAWVMVLWALKRYRSLADTLATPPLMPLARRIITMVSTNRHRLSRWLGLAVPGPACADGTCAPPRRGKAVPG